MLPLHVDGRPTHIVTRLLDRYARLEPCEQIDRSRVAVGERVVRSGRLANHHARHVERRLEERMHAGEPLGRHADDDELAGVQAERLADDVRPAPELALPHAVAQDYDRTASRHLIVDGRERPANRGRHAKRREIVAVDENADGNARLLVALLRVSERRVLRRGEPFERPGLPLDVIDLRIRESADRVALIDRCQAHDAAGSRNRQRPQQKRVDEAEDGRRRADTERRRQQHRQRKPLVPQDQTERVSDLAKERDHLLEIRRSLELVRRIRPRRTR